MARCNSCGLMSSIEMEDSFDADVDVSAGEDTIEISVSGELIQLSACCGDQMASASAEDSLSIPRPCDCGVDDDEPSAYYLETSDAEPEDRYQTTDRHGKPIKSFRYQRHFWGQRVTGTVRCEKMCDEGTADFDVLLEVQGSGFEAY